MEIYISKMKDRTLARAADAGYNLADLIVYAVCAYSLGLPAVIQLPEEEIGVRTDCSSIRIFVHKKCFPESILAEFQDEDDARLKEFVKAITITAIENGLNVDKASAYNTQAVPIASKPPVERNKSRNITTSNRKVTTRKAVPKKSVALQNNDNQREEAGLSQHKDGPDMSQYKGGPTSNNNDKNEDVTMDRHKDGPNMSQYKDGSKNENEPIETKVEPNVPSSLQEMGESLLIRYGLEP